MLIRMKYLFVAFLLPGLFPANILLAAEISDVKPEWRTPFDLYLTPVEAFEMKNAQPDEVVFIDVRTRAEVKFIGFADSVDANIPLRFLREDYSWSDKASTFRTRINPDFVASVGRLIETMRLDRDSPVILMCQSGSRVPVAARKLHEAGYTRVYTQYQGFEGRKATTGKKPGQRVVNGWKNADLPWRYQLDKKKMYFNFGTDSE